MGRKLLEPIFI